MNDKSKHDKEPVQTITAPALVEAPKAEPAKVGDVNIAPTTTAAADKVAVGQREVNLMWETTQRNIALSVTWSSLAVAMFLAIASHDVNVLLAACVFLFGVANLVIGFYFGRTNHQRVSGAGNVESGR